MTWIPSAMYESGNKVTEKPEILFARLDLKEVLEKCREEAPCGTDGRAKHRLRKKKRSAVIDIEAKPEITFDDFAKLQFQVGEIIACEAVKKSKKLLCSQVKIGSQVKQIVSGIQAHLHAGRDGRQEGYGTGEPEACQTGRRPL